MDRVFNNIIVIISAVGIPVPVFLLLLVWLVKPKRPGLIMT